MLITTERLDLHPLPLPVLDALLDRDYPRARALVPFALPDGVFDDDDHVLTLRQRQLRDDPADLPWLYRAAVLAAGRLGWAREQGAVRCLASTAPDNVASQAVLARLGFVRTGEWIDEVDGLEWVYALELQQPAPVG